MFQNETLNNHLKTASSIKINSFVTAEWNMNIAGNISKVGNYRYRPTDGTSNYYKIINTYSNDDTGNFYTNATDADIVIDGGVDNENVPVVFQSPKQKEKLLYSLEACFERFRPRSGINKMRYFPNRYLHHSNIDMAQRPRYYMAHKDDVFKYWSSYRYDSGFERGIANNISAGNYYIDDAAPFVVYEDAVPANRVVVKMQTNVGDADLGPFKTSAGTFNDPLYGNSNKTVPLRWKIQYLDGDSWTTAISFNETSSREDGSPIVDTDGYVEIQYGLVVPEEYKDIFYFMGSRSNASAVPAIANNGWAYLVKTSNNDIGTYYIYLDEISGYATFTPTYGWQLFDENVNQLTNFVTDLTSPDNYLNPVTGQTEYREFQNIAGLRVVVETMNVLNSTFDLIELSPRLTVDLSDKTTGFSVTKAIADAGASTVPTGNLLAGVGSITLFDYDSAFSSVNTNSIVKDYIINNIQFKMYEVVMNLEGYDYYIPIKTMYSDGFQETNASDRISTIQLRDLFFNFESQKAPQIFVQDVSLSYAISLLLDGIGFSNYSFYRLDDEVDPIIPFFFVEPDRTVAEILQQLAVSTQYAMFFDEYNNFIVMSKNYVMPSDGQRETSATLIGTKDFAKDGIVLNSATNASLSNILQVQSSSTDVYNDGVVNYKSRYIQRSYGSLSQSMVADRYKTWSYKPVLLWEASGTELTKSINNEDGNQSSYVLSAIPLNSDLTASVPSVSNNRIIDNILDFGEGIYWISRYNGYFYANGEIIKYDAVEFAITGSTVTDENGQILSVVWITSNQEYQYYFSKLAFNGKMYPTGRVRIYAEPNYETVDGITVMSNGQVAKHGRAQFGTKAVIHYAGLDPYWSNNDYVRRFYMDSSYIFDSSGQELPELSTPTSSVLSGNERFNVSRTSIIKNFLGKTELTEDAINKLYATQTGTIQSSALVMQGAAKQDNETDEKDYVSYVYKEMDNKYTHFGTRLRVIGKIENSTVRGQTPAGSSGYYTVGTTNPTTPITVGGSSGGLGIFVNPSTHAGYYFELAALSETNLSTFNDSEGVYNIIFYKVMQDADGTKIPQLLWGGLSRIIVDDGLFTGQYRIAGEENPTVYDTSIEYKETGNGITFYLYVNNQLVSTVTDTSPLPKYKNMALFVRGRSRLMFEHIYAISNNYADNASYELDTPINSVFDDDVITVNEAFRRYALSGMVQSTYLAGIGSTEPPKYNIYYDEFGTIMREAAYFNVRYDKAYPAIYAKLSPTFNRIKGYTTSGFMAGSYGAEFLIFNHTDTALTLDEKTGNYLRIQGVTFTQQASNELTVDEYFDKLSDFSNPVFGDDGTIRSPLVAKELYNDIRNSRITYGRKQFTIDAPFIQDVDAANDIMDWMISKVAYPRKTIGVQVFGMSTIQLGDIVTINYKDEDATDQVADGSSQFIVYHIEYTGSDSGPSMVLYLSEVV